MRWMPRRVSSVSSTSWRSAGGAPFSTGGRGGEHADDADVVGAAARVGRGDERAREVLGRATAAQPHELLGALDVLREPVRAEHHQVAWHHVEHQRVHLYRVARAHAAHEHVAVRRRGSLLGGHGAAPHGLGGERVVVGELHGGLLTEEVQLTVAHVAHHAEAPGQEQRGAGGAHPALARVGDRRLIDLLARGLDGVAQELGEGVGRGHPRRQRLHHGPLALHHALDAVRRHARGHFTAGVAPHAIAHHEEPERFVVQDVVFVVFALEPDVRAGIRLEAHSYTRSLAFTARPARAGRSRRCGRSPWNRCCRPSR
jgi:hypothetical protein